MRKNVPSKQQSEFPNSSGKEKPSHVLISEERFHAGPLPPAELLQKYEEVYPGAAKMIFDQFKEQTSHRIYIENKVIDSNIKSSKQGLNFGFTVGMTTIIGGVVCILFGHEIGGIILSGSGLTSLVSVFVYGKKTRQKELDEKKEDSR